MLYLFYNTDMISIDEFDDSKVDTLKFTIKKCNSSFANAIRRIILSDVETVSFDIDDYINSDLKVIKNTSSLHNEFLLHKVYRHRLLVCFSSLKNTHKVFAIVEQNSHLVSFLIIFYLDIF